MLLAALALTLFGMHGPEATVRRFTVKPWTIAVSTDKANGEIDCVIQGNHVAVFDDTLVVDFGRHTDTSRPFYRTSGQDARLALANWPRNMPRSVIDGTPTANPSDGIVTIPVAEVLASDRVYVMPAWGARAAKFDLRGLAMARDAAVQAGCSS